MSRQPGDLRPGKPDRQAGPGGPGGPSVNGNWRWIVGVAVAVLVLLLLLSQFVNPQTSTKTQSYSTFYKELTSHQVKSATVEVTGNGNASRITYTLVNGGPTYTTNAAPVSTTSTDAWNKYADITVKQNNGSLWSTLLPYLVWILLLVGFFVWISRRAQGQMSGIMSIGRSKAKVYTTERPRTTFADVAGYDGVKLEIREVVDFLRSASRFKDIGAKIPKGVLLVGPPGTGKTLLARAVAGEAGVPFMSVTGSDFMEMFVGVGASRVRDLFQTARKQAPAIIFIDEIDSIGRKRGAGLGGGHDEREQTLNQMLAEMDGFEATEGIVMMAATNRPDILDPALLRPGRFDRQVVVPLPDLEERLPILAVHCRDKRIAPDVDLSVVARGTPGMSGADLANLVNEAALHAVRRGAQAIHMADFEAARDRVLMGQRRESTVLSDKEKEATAYHEGGHALLAYVLPDADPVHKVTILPTGMALGVTQQLPIEERHTYWREYIEDTICVMMGGRCAERLEFGTISTGGSNDIQRATELARKMVREFGMSDRIGPMAWGQEGQVFLGEDLMHNARDYSDVTSRVIDEEVERILREQEARAGRLLNLHRRGLALVAKALLDRETIDGAEVGRLVDEAFGRPVHEHPDVIPTFSPTESIGGHDPEATPAGGAGVSSFPMPTNGWQQSGIEPLDGR
ncbi:MAG TPA: ATP-dependent zinc metalloprotease FtsH [Acidimicrobiales bacterium]|nr:ATP-dependent zinc metalloprotease FtsH [Acidimicrobiales bacterium]